MTRSCSKTACQHTPRPLIDQAESEGNGLGKVEDGRVQLAVNGGGGGSAGRASG